MKKNPTTQQLHNQRCYLFLDETYIDDSEEVYNDYNRDSVPPVDEDPVYDTDEEEYYM